MAATRACFGGTRHQSAHHEEEEDKGSLRQCSGLLHHFPPHSSTSWSCFPCARLSPLHRRGFSSPSRGAAACWFKPPQSVLGRGEAHMPSARLVDDYWQ